MSPTLSPLQAVLRIGTPLGEMLLAATADGMAGAWFDAQAHHPGPLLLQQDAAHPHLQAAARAFDVYWRDGAGAAQALLDSGALALDAQGTPFQRAVWRQLLQIAPGTTCRYGDIAAALGHPTAARAVGAAVGRNPIGILVPCHRVIGANGALTGYAGGLPRKRALLAHEALRPWAQAGEAAEAAEAGETGGSGGSGNAGGSEAVEATEAAEAAAAAASPARREMAA